MASSFAAASNQYLSAAAPISAAPFTMSAWINPTTTSGNRAVVELATGNNAQRFLLYLASGGVVSMFTNDETFFTQSQAGTASANSWSHVCAVETGGTRIAYLNAVAGNTATAARAPAGVDELNIGGDRNTNSLGFLFDGLIAEVGVWSVALTAEEIASLAKGVACRLIRPQSLVFYAPLIRELQDVGGGLTITNNNTATVGNHPRVYA